MFAASDDETQPPPQQRGNPRNVVAPSDIPVKLKFLQQSCKCQRGICLQQFLDQIDRVEAKRAEFKSLQDHEKDTGKKMFEFLIRFFLVKIVAYICFSGSSPFIFFLWG